MTRFSLNPATWREKLRSLAVVGRGFDILEGAKSGKQEDWSALSESPVIITHQSNAVQVWSWRDIRCLALELWEEVIIISSPTCTQATDQSARVSSAFLTFSGLIQSEVRKFLPIFLEIGNQLHVIEHICSLLFGTSRGKFSFSVNQRPTLRSLFQLSLISMSYWPLNDSS